MKTFDEIWQRITAQEGGEFRQIWGKMFTYKVSGNSLIPRNYLIPKSQIEKAWKRMPLKGPERLAT